MKRNLDISNEKLLHREDLTKLHNIINTVYLTSEQVFWGDGYERISLKNLEQLNQAHTLFVAKINDEIAGCVRVSKKSTDSASFSMLTVDFDYRRKGLAGNLIKEAELWAINNSKTHMELELLIPQEFKHPDKEHLISWYTALGYRKKSVSDFSTTHPKLDPILKIPCDFVVYQKDLN